MIAKFESEYVYKQFCELYDFRLGNLMSATAHVMCEKISANLADFEAVNVYVEDKTVSVVIAGESSDVSPEDMGEIEKLVWTNYNNEKSNLEPNYEYSDDPEGNLSGLSIEDVIIRNAVEEDIY